MYVISILQFLKEALYLWNVSHIPPGAGPPIRSRLAHQALDLFQGVLRDALKGSPHQGPDQDHQHTSRRSTNGRRTNAT